VKENLKPVAIWGAGGHSKVVAASLPIHEMCVACYIESPPSNTKQDLSSTTHVILESNPISVLAELQKRNIRHVILGFGNCRGRLELGNLISNSGFELELVTIVHPTAVIADSVKIGIGVFIGAGCVIDPDVTIGDYSILNHRAVVCHESTIGRACHICPGVTIAGRCAVGDSTWLGVGSTCRDRIQIGERVFVGSGSNVVSDIAPGSLAFGNPARRVRSSPDGF